MGKGLLYHLSHRWGRIVVFLSLLLVLMVVAGCRRGSGEPPAADGSLPAFGTPPSPTLEPLPGEEEEGGFDLPIIGEREDVATPEAEGIPTDPAFEGRFTNLRFAASNNGQPQSSFPVGTQEVYAIWDYDGMRATDVMERL